MTIRPAGLISIHCLPSLLALLIATGCGQREESIPTAAASGRVTLNGAPLPEGTITFFPDKDQLGNPLRGQMAQARITQGEYKILNPPGVVIGKNRVAISATKVVGKEKRDGIDVEKREESLPAKYNAETTLSLDIKSQEEIGNFELTSK